MNSTIIFVTGIGTEIGKTVASAIIVEALQADYFKPVQAGELEYTDTDKVRELISNPKSTFFPSAYALATPMSPHAAAAIDNTTIDLKKINLPVTDNILVVEGAGGLLVPLNNYQTIFDLIEPEYEVVMVSRHYLGSINHSLLTLDKLGETGANISILFNGEENPTTEDIIQEMTGIEVIGRIGEEAIIDQQMIKKYADQFRERLLTQFGIVE